MTSLPLANLTRHKLRSLISALGIGVGIALFVILPSLADGMIREVAERIQNVDAHLMVYPRAMNPIFDTTAATRRLARSIAHSAEDAGKHVGFTVFNVRVAETPLGDQSNVLWYIGMGRTSPLAIDDFVKVLGVGGISRFHSKLVPDTFLHPAKSPIPYLALA